MTDRRAHELDLDGDDGVELRATELHQPELVPLIRRRRGDTWALRRTAYLVPSRDRAASCQLLSDGHVVGELPSQLAAELHGGLLALSTCEPPYLVTVPLRLEWRERVGRTSISATAMIDLHDLRLLASR